MTESATGTAPGRLDVLGGVADYSGALVLQTPLAAATRVRITRLAEPIVRVASVHGGTVAVAAPAAADGPRSPAAARAWLEDRRVPPWARYPLGCLLLFCDRFDWWPTGGLEIDITSDVPLSMGVSSSAALEVATLRALESLAGRPAAGTELARLAQRAENEVVGAACGPMDQLAAAHGVVGSLLPINCRPDLIGTPVPLPAGVVVAGWPSGVRHAVGGSPYATARAAAFMAKRILEDALGRRLEHLTELPPSAVAACGDEVLPDALAGADFLQRFGGVDDPLSSIEADRRYPVRAAAAFATGENHRSQLAAGLLGGATPHGVAALLGELLYQSHLGYSSIGLGANETDAMVAAVRSLGSAQGFHGARISGGGSGGTVVVLLDEAALPALGRLAADMTGTAVIR